MESVYKILFSILDSTNGYSTTAIIAGVFVALPLLIALAFLTISITGPPGMQINWTHNYISHNRKQVNKNVIKDMKELEIKNQKNQMYEEWVEMSYRRLGKTLTFEDFKAEGNSLGFMMFLGGFMIGVLIFVLMQDIVLTCLCAVVGVLCWAGLGNSINKMLLSSKVKQLNFSQKVELPILISRFQAVTVDIPAHPFNRVLELYLPHAGALKYDIEMCLADRRSYGDIKSLTLWQKRVTSGAGSTMIEFTQFCERIKKLYTTGDSIYVKTELASDIRIIDTKYVTPYIKKQSDGRLLKLMGIMLGTFTVLACFATLPMVIQIWEALKGVKM